MRVPCNYVYLRISIYMHMEIQRCAAAAGAADQEAQRKIEAAGTSGVAGKEGRGNRDTEAWGQRLRAM